MDLQYNHQFQTDPIDLRISMLISLIGEKNNPNLFESIGEVSYDFLVERSL